MTIENTYLRIAVPTPLRQYFYYLPPKQDNISYLQPGMRVRIPFQRRELIGIFIDFTKYLHLHSSRLKHVLEVLDQESILSEDVFHLCCWAADYYHYPIGEVFENALPAYLREGKPLIKEPMLKPALNKIFSPVTLNDEQFFAAKTIQSSLHQFQVFLLQGVTGSGKTEVYLEVIHEVLNQDKQILILVPEIGLTPQVIQRFQERFSEPVVALHSGLSKKERFHAWTLSKTGVAKVVIGTRSAVFSSFKNLGLIIVDEEHDLSFKQQEGFRYHARDLAIKRAHFNEIPIVLGSATPSLETLCNVVKGKFSQLILSNRAGNAALPECVILDIRNQYLEEGLSQPLLIAIKEHLSRDEQVLLFLNRRGFAPVLLCHCCGWMLTCQRCDMRMTYHLHSKRLHCHHCDMQKSSPTQCESCGSHDLQLIGLGTERVEKALQKYFPTVSIARVDRDNTKRKGSFEKLLEGIHTGKHQILIGTQMLAKGHHFPDVTLVAILDADGGFFSHDFRGLERMGQLMVQVAGRAGRVEKKGKVMIQTHHPDHPLLHQLLKENYQYFANSLLAERKLVGLPPYTNLVLFRAEAKELKWAHAFLQQIVNSIRPMNNDVMISGPIAAPMPRRAGRYRAHLILQARQRLSLQTLLKTGVPHIEKMAKKSKVRWSLDVDPLEMF